MVAAVSVYDGMVLAAPGDAALVHNIAATQSKPSGWILLRVRQLHAPLDEDMATKLNNMRGAAPGVVLLHVLLFGAMEPVNMLGRLTLLGGVLCAELCLTALAFSAENTAVISRVLRWMGSLVATGREKTALEELMLLAQAQDPASQAMRNVLRQRLDRTLASYGYGTNMGIYSGVPVFIPETWQTLLAENDRVDVLPLLHDYPCPPVSDPVRACACQALLPHAPGAYYDVIFPYQGTPPNLAEWSRRFRVALLARDHDWSRVIAARDNQIFLLDTSKWGELRVVSELGLTFAHFRNSFDQLTLASGGRAPRYLSGSLIFERPSSTADVDTLIQAEDPHEAIRSRLQEMLPQVTAPGLFVYLRAFVAQPITQFVLPKHLAIAPESRQVIEAREAELAAYLAFMRRVHPHATRINYVEEPAELGVETFTLEH